MQITESIPSIAPGNTGPDNGTILNNVNALVFHAVGGVTAVLPFAGAASSSNGFQLQDGDSFIVVAPQQELAVWRFNALSGYTRVDYIRYL